MTFYGEMFLSGVGVQCTCSFLFWELLTGESPLCACPYKELEKQLKNDREGGFRVCKKFPYKELNLVTPKMGGLSFFQEAG